MAKILIVDDSIVTRKNLEYILHEAGHEIVGVAIDGMQAIRLYSELKPDVVTMDISMPKLNGIDALSRIIELDPQAMVIMISALNQKQMLFEALQRGAKHYIIKPVEVKNVINILNKVLYEEQITSEEKLTVEKTIQEQRPAFEVQNVNQRFMVYLNEDFKKKDLKILDLAMQGLMYVKPLKLLVSFEKVEVLEEEIVQYFELLKRRIEQIDGELEYQTN